MATVNPNNYNVGYKCIYYLYIYISMKRLNFSKP